MQFSGDQGGRWLGNGRGTGFGPHGHVQRLGGLRNNAQLLCVCVCVRIPDQARPDERGWYSPFKWATFGTSAVKVCIKGREGIDETNVPVYKGGMLDSESAEGSQFTQMEMYLKTFE